MAEDKDAKQEMNADWGGGQSPCVLVLPVWGSAHKTESAGLSAWRQQKERPFLDMLSIGVLSLCTKSEFGAGKCSVQRPEQNEMGDQAAFFSGCALATGCNSLGLVSRVGNPRVWYAGMPFMCFVGFSPRTEVEG